MQKAVVPLPLNTISNEEEPLTLFILPRKRTSCFINAGLSHNCDIRDFLGAFEENKYWNSFDSPGKRRRRGADGVQ